MKPGTYPRAVRSVPIRTTQSTSNADANRRALRKMTPCELATGQTIEQLNEFHALQRESVRSKYGIGEAA